MDIYTPGSRRYRIQIPGRVNLYQITQVLVSRVFCLSGLLFYTLFSNIGCDCLISRFVSDAIWTMVHYEVDLLN